MQSRGRYFDGESGLRMQVRIELDTENKTLQLSHPDLPDGLVSWPLKHLRVLQDDGARPDQVTLALRANHALDSGLIATARLVLWDADLMRAIRKDAAGLDKKDVPLGTAWKIGSRVTFALGAVALMIFVILPAMAGTLAELIPVEREVRWGKSVVAQMERVFGGRLGSLTSENPNGMEALQAMVSRLTADADLEYDLEVAVFDHPMVNAFAAPGGQIVIMRGLIDKASSPDEVAAVLAHEIGHVEHRDATRNALRAAGSAGLLAMIFGDFSGGSLAVVMAEMTLNSSYTRSAETSADDFAHQMLRDSQVDASGMVAFFRKLDGPDTGLKLPDYLSSHPATAGRADAAQEVAAQQGATRPVLLQAEWQSLREICT